MMNGRKKDREVKIVRKTAQQNYIIERRNKIKKKNIEKGKRKRKMTSTFVCT